VLLRRRKASCSLLRLKGLKKAAGFMWLTGEGKKAAGFTMCEKFFNFGIGGSTREISSSGLFGRLRVFGDGREARELEVEPSSESSHSPVKA